jgi:site-specific recombinase XerD
MAISLWRRHKKCSHKRPEYDRNFKDCSCMIQAEGVLPGCGKYKCLSTGTRIMAEAQRMIFYAEQCRSWKKAVEAVKAGFPLNVLSLQAHVQQGLAPAYLATHSKRIDEAIKKFLQELENPKARKRCSSTISKYKTLMRRLAEFCAERGLTDLDQIHLEELMDFRDSWPTKERATINNINRLRKFYRFCLAFKWVEENLAKKLEYPEAEEIQAQPWEPEEFELILRTAESIQLDKQQAATNEELAVFILVMRHCGLRISDTCLLTKDRILPDGVVRLRMEKKKNKKGVRSWVTTWLPPEVYDRLVLLSLKQVKYFFCHGSTKLSTTTDLWRRRINAVLITAGLKGEADKGESSHRFRHTFAVELLKDGESIENVSKLMGHKNVETTEDAYAAWVTARQKSLIESQRARHTAKLKAGFTVIPGRRPA